MCFYPFQLNQFPTLVVKTMSFLKMKLKRTLSFIFGLLLLVMIFVRKDGIFVAKIKKHKIAVEEIPASTTNQTFPHSDAGKSLGSKSPTIINDQKITAKSSSKYAILTTKPSYIVPNTTKSIEITSSNFQTKTSPNIYDDLKNTEMRSQWMKEMERKYDKTKKRIRQVCQKYNEPPKATMFRFQPWLDFYSGFLIDPKHHVAACWHAKVGSSTLIDIYKKLLPPSKEKLLGSTYEDRLEVEKYFKVPWGGISREVKTTDVQKFLKTSKILSLSIVRHPFERLFSAYKNKVLHDNGRWMKDQGYTKWYQTDHSFPAFVNLVLKEYAVSNCSKNHKNKCSKINDHWRPFAYKCAYCDIQYDVIGDLNTFHEDMKYVILKNNLENLLPIPDQKHDTDYVLKTKNLTLMYFSQLDKSQKDQIYKMYRLDFDLFGYDASMYLRNKKAH